MKRIIILTVLIASTILAMAQGSVEAKIDPIEMLIGEQAEVTLTVQAADDAKVEWPTYQPRQQLVPGVEVLNFHHPTSNTMTLTLTSFDGKLYALPPFVVKINGSGFRVKPGMTFAVMLNLIQHLNMQARNDTFFTTLMDSPFKSCNRPQLHP